MAERKGRARAETSTPHATGRTVSMTMHHYWRLRDGKIEYFRGSEGTALRRVRSQAGS